MKELAPLFAKLGATQMIEAGAGADVSVLSEGTVALLGLDVEGTKHFDYHHSAADTFDKVDRVEIQQNTAVMALLAWVLAEAPFKLGEP